MMRRSEEEVGRKRGACEAVFLMANSFEEVDADARARERTRQYFSVNSGRSVATAAQAVTSRSEVESKGADEPRGILRVCRQAESSTAARHACILSRTALHGQLHRISPLDDAIGVEGQGASGDA